MPIRNRLRDNPESTSRRVIKRDGCHVEIWARYFPTEGVEYHVDVVKMPLNGEYFIEVYCELSGGIGDALKLNRATKGGIKIRRGAIEFIGIAPCGETCGFATCGVEQISGIRSISLRCEGFKRLF